MKYSTNYNMDLPEISEQYNIKHMNENTEIIDSEMKKFQDLFDNLYKNVYPVGCLYWSSKPTDPKELFPGTTWKAIEDKFVYAKGTKDVNSEGGNETITLSVAQLPSHSHTISHTHTYTPSGTVSSHSHSVNITTTLNGAHSHEKGSLTVNNGGSHTHGVNDPGHTHDISPNASIHYGNTGNNTWKGSGYAGENVTVYKNYTNITINTDNSSHSHTISGSTADAGNHTHTVKGNTGASTPTFTGSQANISHNGNSGSTGSGSAINIMPPYVVKYCWERIS